MRQTKNDSYKITLKTEKPAFFVSLDAGDIPGVFSKNFLTLVPGTTEVVTFRASKTNKRLTEKSFQKKLTVTSLRDIY